MLDFIFNYLRSLVDSNSQAEFDFPNFALGLHIGELLQSSKIPSLPTALPQCLRDQVSDFKPPPPPYPPAAPLYSLHEHTTPLKKSELSSKISLPPPPTIDPALSGLPKSVLPYIPPARSADNFAPSQPTIPAQLAQKLHDASSRREFPRIENFSPKLLENTGMDTSSLSLHVQQLLDSQTKELNQLRHTNQLLRDQNQTFQSRVRELEMDVSTSALQLEENRRQETQDRAEINHLTARLEISEEDLAILQQDYRRVALANPRKSSEESFDEQILASLRKEHQEQEINLLASQAALDRSQELLRQSLDTQAWLIAELKGLLVEKKDCMDQLTTLKRNPDMRLLFLRTSLRASQTALTKAQDEALSLRQTITYQCETISDLRGQLRVFYL
jgi:hypothetical protein